MKKLYLYILKQYLSPFIATFFIALFVILMQFLWKYIDDLVGKGLEWQIILELLFYASSTFVPLALPLAVLLSSLMIFGNLGERYELAAIKSSGVSLSKAMRPLIITAFLISVSAFYFSNYVLPIANLKMATVLYDVREQKPALNIKEGIYYKGIENYVIKIAKKDPDGRTIHNIMIYDHSDRRGNIVLSIAKDGVMATTKDKKYLVFTLYNGYNYVEDAFDNNQREAYDPNKKTLRRTSFKENHIRYDLSSFQIKRTNEEFFKDNCSMLNLKQLETTIDTLTLKNDSSIIKYGDNYVRNYIYYQMLKNKKDTTGLSKTKCIAYALSPLEKKQAIESALNFARQRKSDIDLNRLIQDNHRDQIIKHKIEWHSKLSLSITCLILFFIGAPLGAIIRKGGLGWPLVIAIIFFLLFHVVNTIGRKMAKEGAIDASTGIWLAPLVLLPIGFFITYQATRDSALMDADSWKRLIYRFSKK